MHKALLAGLTPENRLAIRNALEPIGWSVEELHLMVDTVASTPVGSDGILIVENQVHPQTSFTAGMPTLLLLSQWSIVPPAAGDGPHEFLRMPAHREEIVARALALSRAAQRERLLHRYEGDLAAQVRRKHGALAAVAQSLGSPLSALIEYLDLLGEEDWGPHAARGHEILEEAKKAARRVAEQVEEMVDASRAEGGVPLRVSLGLTDLHPILEEIQGWAVPRLRAKNQELAIQLDQGMPSVCGDHERLAQALRHLVENAHRYAPPGARIELSAARDPERQGFAQLCVADNGPGIGIESRRRLIEPFAADAQGGVECESSGRMAEAAGAPHLGIGFSIVRAIVAAHGGGIEVTGRPGGGTRALVQIPFWESRAARIAEAQALLARPGGLPGGAWLCRAAGPLAESVRGRTPRITLSPGEMLVVCEEPPAGIQRLGRVRELREAGSLARALQPSLQIQVLAGDPGGEIT